MISTQRDIIFIRYPCASEIKQVLSHSLIRHITQLNPRDDTSRTIRDHLSICGFCFLLNIYGVVCRDIMGRSFLNLNCWSDMYNSKRMKCLHGLNNGDYRFDGESYAFLYARSPLYVGSQECPIFKWRLMWVLLWRHNLVSSRDELS